MYLVQIWCAKGYEISPFEKQHYFFHIRSDDNLSFYPQFHNSLGIYEK